MVICTTGNAIITNDDGRMIKFRHKCPGCGWVDNCMEDLCSIPSGTVRKCSTYYCSSCHKDMGAFEFKRV